MRRRLASRALGLARAAIAATWAALATAAAAQEVPDYEAWESVASRAEAAVEAGRASDEAFESLRAEVDAFRAEFLAAQGINATRLETLRAQLDALGQPPEEGAPEAAEIAQRRAELSEQITALAAPGIAAGEAFSRADGIIGEIDTILRERRAEALFSRGPPVWDLAIWASAASDLNDSLFDLVDGMARAADDGVAAREIEENLPAILVLLAVALVFVLRGRRWLEIVGERLERRGGAEGAAGLRLSGFLISLGQVIVPFIGLLALSLALNRTGLFFFWGERLVAHIPAIGTAIFIYRWLGGRLFPRIEGVHSPLNIPTDLYRRARYLLLFLGLTLAVGLFVARLAEIDRYSEDTRAALVLPVVIGTGYLLFRLGRLMGRHAPATNEEGEVQLSVLDRLVGLLSRLARTVGVVGPLLALVGYLNAAEALTFPAVQTLALFAVLALLVDVMRDIYVVISRGQASADESLVPVLASTALFIFSAPVLALIWGATVNDLGEVWIAVQEGVVLGDTRISPGAFFTLVAVFAVGYAVTRFVQSALRTSVLPKTKLDQGGRTAVVSGLGYIGIFLAALVAISAAGIDLTSLAFIAGALGVGIGFGLQNIVSNFISGIILLVERPISEGDWIEVGPNMGFVRDISVRSTRIETFDRTDVIVPNADLISGTVTNYTRGNTVGRVIVSVGVAYGTDTRRVEALLKEIAEAHPMVTLKPPPFIYFKGFGESSLDFEIRAILRDVTWVLVVQTEMNHAIAERFAEEGIEIPFAQRDLWLRNPEALRGVPKTPAPAAEVAPRPGQASETARPDFEGGDGGGDHH
ncbi:MAG: DUF3772 domain-containing protein [Pseudomonadota bacterium]